MLQHAASLLIFLTNYHCKRRQMLMPLIPALLSGMKSEAAYKKPIKFTTIALK